jgi:hypothetical protein
MPRLTSDFPDEVEVLCKTFELSVRQDTWDPSAFGDALLVLAGSDMQIRISRDRGQFFLEVAPLGPEYEWEYINKTLESLGVPERHDPDAPLRRIVDTLVHRSQSMVAHVRDSRASWPAPRKPS